MILTLSVALVTVLLMPRSSPAAFGLQTQAPFIARVTTIGDVDGDGFSDLALGAFLDGGSGLHAGAAIVFSVAKQQVLFRVEGDATEDLFGFSICSVDDANGDGVTDFFAGTCGGGFPDFYSKELRQHASAGDKCSPGAYARVHSGRDGKKIFYFDTADEWDGFGSALASGDIDGDDKYDYVVAAAGYMVRPPRASVSTYSGVDGSELWRVRDADVGPFARRSLAVVEDVDGDGCDDVVVGKSEWRTGNTMRGRVELLSGKNGDLIRSWNGPAPDSRFGWSVAFAGDMNGDAKPELVVGSRGNGSTILSLHDDKPVCTLSQLRPEYDDGFADSVSLLGDVNNDSLADVAINYYIADWDRWEWGGAPYAEILSGGSCSSIKSFEGTKFGINIVSFDYDLDNALDIAVVDPSSGSINIYTAGEWRLVTTVQFGRFVK